MHSTIPASKLNAGTRLAGWLLVAVAAHTLLLLVPLQRSLQSGKVSPDLVVSLMRVPPQPPPAPVPPMQELPATRPQAGPRSVPAARQETVSPPAPKPLAEASLEQPQPSTAFLLDLAGRREWRLPEMAAPRALGEFAPQPLPSNRRPARAPDTLRSDSNVAPAKVEVVDRWLAADGSHNVVITSPDGDTYCGRVEAWNPMNPLFEPVMMFRTCGGGKRTFDMPHRYGNGGAANERR